MDWLDAVLIPLFRITGDPVSGFFVGTFLLALIAAVLGEATVAGIYLTNRATFERLNSGLVEAHNASVEAALRGDEAAYTFHNRKANDAFTRSFFLQAALGMGSLWPALFALAFLPGHFALMKFALPGTPWSVNCIFIFLLEYVLARLIFNHLKYRIPGVGRLHELLETARRKAREPHTYEDIIESSEEKSPPNGG